MFDPAHGDYKRSRVADMIHISSAEMRFFRLKTMEYGLQRLGVADYYTTVPVARIYNAQW
jgi:hypothetical protein